MVRRHLPVCFGSEQICSFEGEFKQSYLRAQVWPRCQGYFSCLVYGLFSQNYHLHVNTSRFLDATTPATPRFSESWTQGLISAKSDSDAQQRLRTAVVNI